MGNNHSGYDSDDAVEDIERTTKSEVTGLGPSHNDFEETLKNYEKPPAQAAPKEEPKENGQRKEEKLPPLFNIKDDASALDRLSGGLRRALAKKDVPLLKEKLAELELLREELLKVFTIEWLVQLVLERAVSTGFLEAVTLFLPYIHNPDSPQIRHALQIQANIASQEGHYDIALTLCQYHPVCLQQAPSGDSPIIPAAKSEEGFELVLHLIENGACVNVQNSSGTTALHNAVKARCRRNVELLLENRACVNLSDNTGATPRDLVRGAALESMLAEAEEYDDHPSLEEASLYRAARNGDPDFVQAIIDSGLSINTRWEDGKIAIHGAIESSRPDSLALVHCLLDNGAKVLPTVNNSCLFVVNYALLRAKFALAQVLLVVTIRELNHCSSKAKESVPWDLLHKASTDMLYLVAKAGRVDFLLNLVQLCKMLSSLTLGSAVYKGSLQPIHVAAMHGRTEFVRALVGQNESPTATDDHGNTPLHYAAYYGHIATADYLLTLDSVEIDVRNKHRSTPLYTVLSKKIYSDDIEQCLEKSVIFLLIRGARLVTPRGHECELREKRIDSFFNEAWSFVSPHTRKLMLTLRSYEPPLKLAELCRLQVRSLMRDPCDQTFLSLSLPPNIVSFLRCD